MRRSYSVMYPTRPLPPQRLYRIRTLKTAPKSTSDAIGAVGKKAPFSATPPIAEDSFVGCCGIALDKRGREGQPELGYWIAKPFWGRGYGTAAAFAVLKRVFSEQGFPFIVSGSYTHNPASMRILEKCGFQPDGGQTGRARNIGAVHLETGRFQPHRSSKGEKR